MTHGVRTRRWFIIASWALVLAAAAFIFWNSSRSASSLHDGNDLISIIYRTLGAWQLQLLGPDVDFVSGLGHFVEFTLFGALLANALCCHLPVQQVLIPLVAIGIASLYGVTDELHQIAVPGRFCDPADWLTDTIGATLGAFAAWAIIRRVLRRRG